MCCLAEYCVAVRLEGQLLYIAVCCAVQRVGRDRFGVATISRLLQIIGLFAEESYKIDYILQKRPIILRSLLIVATPNLPLPARCPTQHTAIYSNCPSRRTATQYSARQHILVVALCHPTIRHSANQRILIITLYRPVCMRSVAPRLLPEMLCRVL